MVYLVLKVPGRVDKRDSNQNTQAGYVLLTYLLHPSKEGIFELCETTAVLLVWDHNIGPLRKAALGSAPTFMKPGALR